MSSMKISMFATKNPIFSVSLKHADEETIQPMLRTLAWMWTLDHIDYKKVRDVLSKKTTFVVPDNRIARLVVVPQYVHAGQTYDPDTDSVVVREEGKLKGCYMAALKSVNILPDADLAAEFIIRLGQVEDLWELVEDGKKLPDVEPAPKSKKAKAKNDEDKKPVKKQPKKPPIEDEFDDELDDADEQDDEQDADDEPDDSEADEAEEEASLIELWGKLNGDGVSKRLNPMSFGDRERLCRELKAEHDDAVAEADAFIAKVKQGLEDQVTLLNYLFTAIGDFNGPKSVAFKLMKELNPPKIEVRSRTDGKDQKQQRQQNGQGKDQKKDQKKQPDDAGNAEKNYISRQLKKVKKQIARAEQEGDKKLLDLLDDMLIALEDGDTKAYNALKAKYDKIISGDTGSSDSGEDTGSGSDSGSDSSDGDGDDAGDDASGDAGDDAGSDSEGDGDKPDSEDDDYTIADILATLALSGYTNIPKPFKIMAKGSKVTAESANAVFKQYGIDIELA